MMLDKGLLVVLAFIALSYLAAWFDWQGCCRCELFSNCYRCSRGGSGRGGAWASPCACCGI